MITYKTLASGQLQCNGTLIWDDSTRAAVLIDPTDDATPFLDYIASAHLEVKYLLLTHGHVDHAASVCKVSRKLGLIPRLHAADLPIYHSIPRHAAMFGIHAETMDIEPDSLTDGEILDVAPGFQIQVLHTPGHTQGGVCFYLAEQKLAIVGDTLFRESVGRTDLPGGSQPALVNSIRQVLYALPADTVAIPGHGPSTTIGHEMQYNAFVHA